jgi:SAM-dependent methyltransferase
LSLDENVVMHEFEKRVRLPPGTVLVEIGGDAGRSWAQRLDIDEWHSVDPRNENDVTGAVTRWRACAESMPFASESTDAIFSCNALQFVNVVPVIAEAYRILRSGGIFYAHFGPVWSGPDGHQLEYVRYHGRDLQFWQDTLLPPYAHLRFSPDELRSVLSSRLRPDLVEVLVAHVFESETINRLFVEDYLEAFSSSPFAIREFVTSAFLDYSIDTPQYDHPLLDLDFALEDLGKRTACENHPSHHLGTRDIRVLLQKTGMSNT